MSTTDGKTNVEARYDNSPNESEKELTKAILDIIREFIQRRFNEKRRPALRDAHAKDTGCIRAIFRVDANLDPKLQHGVFIPGKEYKAWIRFSDGNSEVRNAHWPDARGMAIKLVGVEGDKLSDDERETQDFIMANRPVFFVRGLETYRDTLKVFHSGGTFMQLVSVFKLKWRERPLAIKGNFTFITNPLFSQYWSQTPYRLGTDQAKENAIKFTAKPRSRPEGFIAKARRLALATVRYLSPNFSVKQQMANTLASHETWFDFYVQRYVDEQHTPIDDPTKNWKKSPLNHVAKIVIPCQDLFSPDRDFFCENLSFSPWHCLPEHEPLGPTNRVRKKVYSEISRFRHELNGRPKEEPTGDETF